MESKTSKRFLSISEFAAATQLSAKALRLYDQQGILHPSIVDSANGYRYYAREQITKGRLVRTLREMDLSLSQISQLVAAGSSGESLLYELSRDIDRRYAREKRAFQSTLLMLRQHERRDLPCIQQKEREPTVFLVHSFRCSPNALSSRFLAERQRAVSYAEQTSMATRGPALFEFTEHSSEDELALDLLLPIDEPKTSSGAVTIRRLPARKYAALSLALLDIDAAHVASLSDALFDWFDRAGHRSVESPLLLIPEEDSQNALLMWAFEPT